MAGMFYSLQEVVAKLRKTKEQVEELVSSGRLREFRDGANLLFKIDEVEALMSDTSVMRSEEPSAPQAEAEEEQILLQPKPSEPPEAPIIEDELTGADTTAVAGEAIDTADEIDIDGRAIDDAKTDTSGGPSSEEEISLEAEPTETGDADEQLTDADTVVAGKETEGLGEDDGEYKMADDMMGETKAGSGEALLEEIEEDVNLDSFGSGSGLLDLSLQADDTSLGGVLDEIYTPEGEKNQQVGKESEMEVAAEPEQELAEDSVADVELAVPAVAQAYIEPEPDTLSNSLGIMLFLPLLAVVYTMIVAVAGFNDVMPAILEKVQGIIWYIVIALAVAAALIVGMPFMLGGKAGKAGAKPKAKRKKKKAAESVPTEPEAENP